MDIDKENVIQAVVLMDTFNNNFNPVTKNMGLLSIAGVPLVDFVLESLAQGGVGETILFCCKNGNHIKEYIQQSKLRRAPWSWSMEVQVMMSETCETMGDVMREIDAAGIIRGFFILTGVNSITNISYSSLLEQHKQNFKKDKGAAMTLVFKKLAWKHPLISSDKPIFLAANAQTNKVLMHQKYKHKSQEKTLSVPLEILLNHSEVKLHHNLADANIALCSASVPPLFSDNFDFQTRDDFIHGILINEDILASTLYYTLVKSDQYAASVTNWKTYQIVCQDILHHWADPLSIETGTFYQDKYEFLGNHNYRNKNTMLSRSCCLEEDVLIGDGTQISDNTTLDRSVIGKNCSIGKNVTLTNCHILDNVVVKDNCTIVNSFVDDDCVIEENSTVTSGSIIGNKVVVKAGSKLEESIIESADKKTEKGLSKSTSESGTDWENESSGSEAEEFIGFDKRWSDSESCYSSASSGQSTPPPESPVPEDTNIFLNEVIDSLARGFEEKLKCDYLILEINSSRYAYNIQLDEVNFFVVRALLSLPVLVEAKNVLSTVKDIMKFFRPVLDNYIKSKSSVMDCLRAVEESCLKCEWLNDRAGQIVHLLYESDVIDEDSLLEWHKNLKVDESPIVNQTSFVKFFEWLQQASEESEESE